MITKLKTISLLTIGLILNASILLSQDITVEDYERKLSYTEFESDYYVMDQKDLPNLALSDKVMLKELKYERAYEQYMNAANERTTIIKNISTENVYEDWMEEPEIIVIDKEAVSHYSNEGKRINRIDHTPTYLDLAKRASIDLLPTFAVPSREQLQKMTEMGIQVIELEDNYIQINSQSIQMIYNEDLLYIEKNELSEAGEVMHSVKTHFMQLPSGEIVIERIKESTVVMLKNNIRAENISLRLYSNHLYENRLRDADQLIKQPDLSITTTTDQSLAIIKYNPFGSSPISTISIYSTNGRLIKAYQTDNKGNTRINIDDLTPGVYIIQIQNSGQQIAEKFIKL